MSPVRPQDGPTCSESGEGEVGDAVRAILRYIGEDPSREGLRDTPDRVVRSLREMFGGYFIDVGQLLSRTFEEINGYDDVVTLLNIPFFSHCEHHMLPFFGKAHIGYFPRNRVVGLSKIARTVDAFARRLQTQESLTAQIADALDSGLQPEGVAVIVEAEHLCMRMRGVKLDGIRSVTHRFRGQFSDRSGPREQMFAMAGLGR